MPRFKFQTPTGSIIMEFDDTSTVYQVRMFLSQTIERKVQGLVAVAEKGSSFHAVSRLADSQRMRDVDRKAVILLDCEKLKLPENNPLKRDTPRETSSTSVETFSSRTQDSEEKSKKKSGLQTSKEPSKNQGNESSIPSGLSLPEVLDELGTDPKTSPSVKPGQAFESKSDWKNPSNPMLAALSLSNGPGVFGPLPFNFNPFLLIPAVLKYCIHFEIDHFNINAEIFSHATMGCTAASMEKTLSLPMGEFMDSQGKFLPIVKHFMRSEEERAEIYSTVKAELRKAASVMEQQAQQNPISFPHRLSNMTAARLKPDDRRVTFLNSLSKTSERDVQNSADIPRPPNLSELSFFKLATTAPPPPPLASVQASQPITVPPLNLPNNPPFGSQTSPDHSNSSLPPNSALDPNAKRMRRRTTITRSAKIVMVEWYLSNGRYLTAEGRQLLSGHLGLTEENVRVFFKNLRRLEKKCEETGTPLMDAINGVDNENSNLSEDLQLVSGSFDDDSSPTMIKLETID